MRFFWNHNTTPVADPGLYATATTIPNLTGYFRTTPSVAEVPPTPEALQETERLYAEISALLEDRRLGGEKIGVTIRRLAAQFDRLEYDRAQRKAEQTLVEHLDSIQRKSFAKERSFLVKGKTMTYRLSITDQPRIVAGSQKGTPFCINPTQRIPRCDELLAIKLWIEANEEAFLKEAHPHSQPHYYFDPDGRVYRRQGYGSNYPLPNTPGGVYDDLATLREGMRELDRLAQQAHPELQWPIGGTLIITHDILNTTTFGDTNQTYTPTQQFYLRDRNGRTIQRGAGSPAVPLGTTLTPTTDNAAAGYAIYRIDAAP